MRRSRSDRTARLLRQLSKDLSAFNGEPCKPPPHKAKDVLSAVVTLAVIGAILLQLTNGIASRCGAKSNPGTGGPGGCSGLAAIADHARGAVTLTVAACAALAVITFLWYIFWGYKTNGQAGGNGDSPGL